MLFMRGLLIASALAAIAAFVVSAVPPSDASEPAPGPAAGDLNALVLRVAESYPRDGTHTYHWPKGSSWAGTTRDLFYLGRRVADGDPQGRAYCCGLTFE